MIDVEIRLQEDVIAKIEKDLEGVENPRFAIKEVLNNTAKNALELIASQTKDVYSYRGNVKKSAKVRKATVKANETEIVFKSPVHEPRDFKVSPAQTANNISKAKYTKTGKRTKGRTVKMKVLASSGMKPLEGRTGKAFIVQFKSGHVAVVSRDPQKKMRKNPKKAALRKILSPSIPIMAGNEKVYDAKLSEIYEIMDQQTKAVISKILGG